MHFDNIGMLYFLHNGNLVIDIVVCQHITIFSKQFPPHLLFLNNFNSI